MITLFGQFAIFIAHYLSKMLVCPLDFSTRQKDRFEFFRFGEHAVLARSVPRGSSTPAGRMWGGRRRPGLSGQPGSAVCGHPDPALDLRIPVPF